MSSVKFNIINFLYPWKSFYHTYIIFITKAFTVKDPY